METFNRLNYWQIPQRQSPAAIFIMLWSTAINLLKGFWPLLVLYFFKGEKDGDSLTLLWLIIGFSSLSILGAVIGYWFKKFHLHEDTLIIQTGWLQKKTLSIPVHTIQAVHLEQNLWQQAFNVAKVSFDSIGSDKVEAKLDALAMEKAEQLRHLLMAKVNMSPEAIPGKPTEARHIYSLSFGDLMKLSLTANHLEAFFILLALLFNVFDEFRQIFGDSGDFDSYGRQLFGQTAIFMSILFLAVAILSLVFSIIRTMIRFYGFELVESGQRWIMSFGLFDKTKKIIPLKKIQILSWRANWLRRKIDYWTVQVQSVGHKENRKSNIHIPVTSFEQVIRLVEGYQTFIGIADGDGFKIEPAYWKRKSLKSALFIVFIPMMLSFFWIEWYALGLLVILPYVIWNNYQWYRNFLWQTNENGLQLRSGVFGRKFKLLSWKKIQQVHLHQNLYQKNHQLATVIFITAGGKLILPYLRLSTATALADQILYEVESKEEDWM